MLMALPVLVVEIPPAGEIASSAVGTPAAKVYMTTDISPAGLMMVYQALGRIPSGKVAVKISTGEPGNTHSLAPSLVNVNG
ncbi:MAG: hypothetical protein LBD79_04200 [Treponema sp.]|jgi:uncharacterized Fe-S center protein|nr:hypothetical protein [Treponema sp.]